MTPENFFDPKTERFVALREYAIGTTAYGYGPDQITAEAGSNKFVDWPVTETRVYERTEATVKRGKYLWQVYRRVES